MRRNAVLVVLLLGLAVCAVGCQSQKEGAWSTAPTGDRVDDWFSEVYDSCPPVGIVNYVCFWIPLRIPVWFADIPMANYEAGHP